MKNPQVYQQLDSDTYSLTITQRNGKQHIVLIDADMVDVLSQYCWNIASKGYVQAKMNGRLVLMHRFIMDAKERSEEIDHENHNTLDNRKNNLRWCTRSGNTQNRKAQKHSSTGIKGVTLWVGNGLNVYAKCVVTAEGTQKTKLFSVAKLGLMPAVRDAAIAARALREQLHGQYACH